MTAKSVGNVLACVGTLVLVGGVGLLVVSRDIDGVSGFSIAGAWCIVVAGAANVTSGLILRRQVWRRRRSGSNR
ncbi:hypothetical protein [Frigoribacterium sp. CFBP 13712]|uniref:hypothetical protein n=1 Tax=Frigoribacterium sp. CFBP 13712 TaxID=2775309 RepID=UPI0017827580|nr:hypothetical protein [Frigoribacterium sp. CFBP 13712]MBD8704996.1 hypothetical protein [Frigoribacterium sp. CFBP 13712]